MNAVFHYIKTLAIVHKSRCHNHLANMKPKSEHNETMLSTTTTTTTSKKKQRKQAREIKTMIREAIAHHMLLSLHSVVVAEPLAKNTSGWARSVFVDVICFANE